LPPTELNESETAYEKAISTYEKMLKELPLSKITVKNHEEYLKGFNNILNYGHPKGEQPIEEISE
jgi:hypothetical protein